MTVWQRISRFAVVGLAVGSLTACSNLVGWFAAGSSGSLRTNGWGETVGSSLTAYFIGGNWHSRTAAVNNSGGLKNVQTRHMVKPGNTGCFWSDVSCDGIANKKLKGRVYATTDDNSGDGWISGAADFQPAGAGQNCGMNSAATATFGMPASAFWQDRVNCAYNDPNYASALTDGSFVQAWGSTATTSTHGSSFLNYLPLETIQGIMNSMESSDLRTEYLNGIPMTVARAQVTKVSVGGESYRPVNVFIEVYNWRMTKWDMTKEPGLKLMAAWMANKMEQVLERGATSIRLSVELNNGVTLTRADLPSIFAVTEPTFATVEHLRSFATTNVRD